MIATNFELHVHGIGLLILPLFAFEGNGSPWCYGLKNTYNYN